MPAACPLCGLAFGDSRVTGQDVSPYANSYSAGTSGWRTMLEWVWFAGSDRLHHLALMRASAASRRFHRINLLLLSLGLAVFVAAHTGWRWVSRTPAIEPTGSITPLGRGWLHAAAAPRPLPLDLPPERAVDLWWSPVQMVIGLASGFLAAWVLLTVVAMLVRVAVTRAHGETYRHEQRMTAALHYSTAWSIPLLVAALVASLVPVSYVSEMARWMIRPAAFAFETAAGVVAALGGVLWWFWLVRLGATAPPRARGRVSVCLAAVAPLLFVGLLLSGGYALRQAYDPLFVRLRVNF